jgi:hypothetical protein
MKRKAGRPFGSKKQKPVVVTEDYKKNFGLTFGNSNQYKCMTKIEQRDREYLMSVFEIFEKSTENIVPKGNVTHNGNVYQPEEMFRVIMEYFRFTISNSRPLTLSGIGIFCGFYKSQFEIIRKTKKETDPIWGWLQKCVYFVEMYIEYTAQLKINPAFQIFWLKNRGWQDKLEISTATPGALSEEEREEMKERVKMISERS